MNFFIFFLITFLPFAHQALEVGVLPTTESAIDATLENGLNQAQEELDRFLAVPVEARNFDNTVRVWDLLKGQIIEISMNLESVVQIHPEKKIRDYAEGAYQKINERLNEILSDHPEIYDACLAIEKNQNLSEEESYYLKEVLSDFRLRGMQLTGEKRAIFRKIQQEIVALESLFERQVAENLPVIYVSKEDLTGIGDDWISSKEQNEQGLYKLECDLPTHNTILFNCSNRETRKRMYDQFTNRAFPENEEVLKQLIAKRDALAKLLGYLSFSAFSLSSQMVGNPERAEAFLQQVREQAAIKADAEFKEIRAELPEGISDKLERFDLSFAGSEFKKRHFDVNQRKIAEYFPMEKTVQGLMRVYEQFFSLSIQQIPHTISIPDLMALELREHHGNLLGTIYLDLFPREGKTSHSGIHFPLVYPYSPPEGPVRPAVSLIIGNFTKPTQDRPSLMTHQEVITFFHEFGHAIHNLLGRSQFLCFCGTRVKRDFVELPSQLLEEWMWDPEILRLVSSHYITKEPLPDALIENMNRARFFGIGILMQRSCFLSELGLAFFDEGEMKDPAKIMAKIWDREMPQVGLFPNDHFYASWWHLTGYGPRYYGYLWSQVFAVDIFEQIRREGLLNPVAGHKYAQDILSKGGARDPNQLLIDFLGRDPSAEPFFKRLQ